MNKNVILPLALAALLLMPSAGFSGQDDRFERLRERAQVRREMRDLARERFRTRADVGHERMRLRSEVRGRVREALRGFHGHDRQAYRDTVRDALRTARRALRDAFRDRW
jgi:hypothetical protein